MSLINDVDFIRDGFVYGAIHASLRKLVTINDYDLLMQAAQDDGPNWKVKCYMRGHEEDDFTLVSIENFENYNSLLEFLSDQSGTNITERLQ